MGDWPQCETHTRLSSVITARTLQITITKRTTAAASAATAAVKKVSPHTLALFTFIYKTEGKKATDREDWENVDTLTIMVIGMFELRPLCIESSEQFSKILVLRLIDFVFQYCERQMTCRVKRPK